MEERGCYRTLLDELITTDIPDYRNFTRIEPAFFDLIEERITPHLKNLPGTFGFSRCRLQVPVGQRGVQWLII